MARSEKVRRIKNITFFFSANGFSEHTGLGERTSFNGISQTLTFSLRGANKGFWSHLEC